MSAETSGIPVMGSAHRAGMLSRLLKRLKKQGMKKKTQPAVCPYPKPGRACKGSGCHHTKARETSIIAFILLVILFASNMNSLKSQTKNQVNAMETIRISCPAFGAGAFIPLRHTCDGENVFPGLEWGVLPQGTKSLALIMDDPDAPSGDWVHFVLYNIPPGWKQLPGDFRPAGYRQEGIKAGVNSAGRPEYYGPCPPSGIHRYFFKLFALDCLLEKPEGINKKELLSAMEGHILAKGELMGKYQRKK